MTKTSRMIVAVMAALLAAPFAAQAQPWNGAPGAAVIDEQSVGIYQTTIGNLQYNGAGSTTSIVGYYNLTDTSATGNPGWTNLELRYYDPSPNSFVRAQIQRLSPGVTSTIFTCTSTDSALINTLVCPLGGASVDFNTGDIYALTVTVSRSSTAVTPMFLGVRLY